MIKFSVILLRCILILYFITIIRESNAQAINGTTGLLHMPTADMQKDKTFMAGGNILHLVPLNYFSTDEIKYTFNYYINITYFPWLEVGYTCTINYAEHGSTYFPQHVWGKYSNQDRRFNARIRLWKEGWWKAWTPQIVAGFDDPASHESYGGGETKFNGTGMNNYFTRYYLAITKHFRFKGIGCLGTHLSWIMGRPIRKKHYDGLGIGANFQFNTNGNHLGNKILNGLNLMIEYDAQTINVGGSYSIWKDHINLISELNNGKYFSGGIFFKVHLK